MRILCYGDSNTWGHNPQNANRIEKRWTKTLQSLLGNEHEIIEEGLCGRCAAFIDSVKPYRYALTTLKATLQTHQPLDLVILMLGTNDLKACFHPNAVAVSNGIKEIVQIIKSPYTYHKDIEPPKILIIAPIYIKESYYTINRIKEQFDEKSVLVSHQLATFYKEIALEYDCMFMDASKYAEASDIDCIHMDEENHKKLAQAIYQMRLK